MYTWPNREGDALLYGAPRVWVWSGFGAAYRGGFFFYRYVLRVPPLSLSTFSPVRRLRLSLPSFSAPLALSECGGYVAPALSLALSPPHARQLRLCVSLFWRAASAALLN